MLNVTSNLDQILQSALQHHQAGRLAEAEGLYRQILRRNPKHAQALHLLGMLAAQLRRHDLAVDLMRQAIALQPNYPEAYSNLGNVLRDRGQLDEAIAAYRQAIALKPNFPEAHNNLGIALKDQGRPAEAIAAYQQAIALQPNHPDTHNNLGNALRDRGQLEEAIAAYRRAIALRPNHPDAHNNLGNALKDQGRLDEAMAAYRQALVLNPNIAETHYNLGNALKDRKQLDGAIAAYRQAIALNPRLPEVHNNLGNVLRDAGRLEEALAAYRQAIAVNPNLLEAYNNLGNVLRDQGQLDAAVAAHRQAIALKPNYAEAHGNLGNALKDRGQLEEAIAAYRQAIALKPDFPDAHSNLLLTMHYADGHEGQAMAEEHRRWNRQHAASFKRLIQPHGNGRAPERRLRIGYVSPDFREHAVAPMVLPLLASHDHAPFEVFCYGEVARPDAMTDRFRSHADHWRGTVGWSDQEMADQIRKDRIDLLIDLAGHTAGNRLLVFARKPAPVQVTRQGYPDTTGLETIDYRMTDAYADPPGRSDELHTEQLIRLPETNWIYEPPPEALAMAVVPVAGEGPVTFGCFNNLAKVTEPMLHLWAGILAAVPGSRLLLKAMALASASVQQRVRGIFAARGIAAERVELSGWRTTAGEHLQLYNRVTIALDPFPYHGTTTTCEALWMGVPVITLAGQTHVSRVGVSLLTNVGVPELIAQSPEEYGRVAVHLANDRPRLAELRATLRSRMEASPLMDAPRFARNIEAAYRQMWRTWCCQPGGFLTVTRASRPPTEREIP